MQHGEGLISWAWLRIVGAGVFGCETLKVVKWCVIVVTSKLQKVKEGADFPGVFDSAYDRAMAILHTTYSYKLVMKSASEKSKFQKYY